MRPLNFLALMVLLLSAALAQAAQPDKMAQADALCHSPSLNLQMAQQALALYTDCLSAGGAGVTLLPRLARACFLCGDLAPKEPAGRLL